MEINEITIKKIFNELINEHFNIIQKEPNEKFQDILSKFDNFITNINNNLGFISNLKFEFIRLIKQYEVEKLELIDKNKSEIQSINDNHSELIKQYEVEKLELIDKNKSEIEYLVNQYDNFLKAKTISKFTDNNIFNNFINPKSIKDVIEFNKKFNEENIQKIFIDFIKNLNVNDNEKIIEIINFISVFYDLIIPKEGDDFDSKIHFGEDIKIQGKKCGLVHKTLKIGMKDKNGQVIIKSIVEVTL